MIRIYTTTRDKKGQFLQNKSFDLIYVDLEEHLNKEITEVIGAEVIYGVVGTPPTATHSVTKILDLPAVIEEAAHRNVPSIENRDTQYLDKLLKLIKKEMDDDYRTANDSLGAIQALAREIEQERVKE